MQPNTILKYLYITVIWLLAACAKPSGHQHSDEDEEALSWSDSMPIASPAAHTLECMAVIDVPPAYVYEIHARTDGFIAGLNILEGRHIKKGELLAKIESPEFARLQKAYLEAAAQFEWQAQNHKRSKELYQLGSLSPKEWQMAERDYATSKAQYEGLGEELTAIGFSLERIKSSAVNSLEIRSNISGMVTHIGVRNGTRVSANTHMFTIIDKSHLHAEISIPVHQMTRIHKDTPFYIISEGDTIRGHVFLINYQTDDRNMVKVHGHFNDESQLENILVGQRLFVRFGGK